MENYIILIKQLFRKKVIALEEEKKVVVRFSQLTHFVVNLIQVISLYVNFTQPRFTITLFNISYPPDQCLTLDRVRYWALVGC